MVVHILVILSSSQQIQQVTAHKPFVRFVFEFLENLKTLVWQGSEWFFADAASMPDLVRSHDQRRWSGTWRSLRSVSADCPALGRTKLFPRLHPSVTVAAMASELPRRGPYKKVWRGNESRGQEWGSRGQGLQPAGQHKRRPGCESWRWSPLDVNIEPRGRCVKERGPLTTSMGAAAA